MHVMHSANEKSKVLNFTIVKIVQPIEFQIQLFIIDKDYNRERHGNLCNIIRLRWSIYVGIHRMYE